MNTIIAEIKPRLEKMFEEYRDKGVLSVYLWGSVTTNDFNILTSDVDSVAIVDDFFDVSLEEKIQHDLQNFHPDIKRFGFRVLYKKELVEGRYVKSNLASYISPRFFIFDLPNWMYVVGKEFQPTDFTDTLPTIKEIYECRIEEIDRRGWKDASQIEVSKEQYYIKCLWRIIHLLQLHRGITNPFSYFSVTKNVNDDEKEIVDALSEIKASEYERETFLHYVPLLNQFVEKVKGNSIM